MVRENMGPIRLMSPNYTNEPFSDHAESVNWSLAIRPIRNQLAKSVIGKMHNEL